MSHPPLYKVNYDAGARISAEIRARNKAATLEFEANFEKISAGLRAWQLALHRNTRFLEEFEELR